MIPCLGRPPKCARSLCSLLYLVYLELGLNRLQEAALQRLAALLFRCAPDPPNRREEVQGGGGGCSPTSLAHVWEVHVQTNGRLGLGALGGHARTQTQLHGPGDGTTCHCAG